MVLHPKKWNFFISELIKAEFLMHLKHIFLHPEADTASGHCFKSVSILSILMTSFSFSAINDAILIKRFQSFYVKT